MASILNNSQGQIIVLSDDPIDNDERKEEKISVWLKDKDIIKPSTNISLLQKIEPGIYTVDFSRDHGIYCKKMDIKSDELFVFSDSISEKLLKEINTFWEKSERYKQNNLVHKRGILLEGFPGTGKSSIISILCKEIISKGGVVFKINGIRNLDTYFEFIRYGFREIQPETPVVTILEDLDQYEEVESELLDFLDGKTHLDHHVVIATTNNTELIPDTFLRPSRIDLKIEVPLPSEQTRREYFKFKNTPEDEIENLVKQSEDFSLADLKELYVCIYLLDYTVEEAVGKITAPKEKKNYLNSSTSGSKLGL